MLDREALFPESIASWSMSLEYPRTQDIYSVRAKEKYSSGTLGIRISLRKIALVKSLTFDELPTSNRTLPPSAARSTVQRHFER